MSWTEQTITKVDYTEYFPVTYTYEYIQDESSADVLDELSDRLIDEIYIIGLIGIDWGETSISYTKWGE